jgi:hypothetical protein
MSFSKKEISMFQKALRAAARRAAKKHLPFELELSDVVNQYSNQGGRCFYSGIDMNISKNSKELHDPYKMTLDCKDSAVGYTKDNVVFCIYCINSFKQKMTQLEIKEICKKVIEYSNV